MLVPRIGSGSCDRCSAFDLVCRECAPWHGSVPKRLRTALMQPCQSSPRKIGTSLRLLGPLCLTGWPNR